jgi:hypothetical protein
MLFVQTHTTYNGEQVTLTHSDIKSVSYIPNSLVPRLRLELPGNNYYDVVVDEHSADIYQAYPNVTPEQYDVILDMLNGWMASMGFGSEFTRIYNLVKTLPISDEAYNKYYMIKRVIDNESHKKEVIKNA